MNTPLPDIWVLLCVRQSAVVNDERLWFLF